MRIDVKGTIIPSEDKWVYDWLGYDSTSPNDINQALEKANGERVDVYINSGGGDVFAGSEIYSALREYSGNVKIHITGIAASAASVIACAGKSEMSPTAQFMVHNVSASGTNGDYHAFDKTSEILQNANEAIAAAYVEKTKMSKEDALNLMDKETWLTAEKALEYGFVDEISQNKNLQLSASMCNLIPQSLIDKLNEKRADEKIKAQERLDKMKGEI